MLHLISNFVVIVAIIFWSIILVVFIGVTLYNKFSGKSIKKVNNNSSTQDLHVQTHNNIDYEEIRKADVNKIVKDEATNSSINNKGAKNNLCL